MNAILLPQTGLDQRRQSAFACAGASILCAVVVIVWFRPGILHSDSVGQLWMGKTGVYSDMHPVLMSWLLGVFDRIVPGPLLALIFQVSLWSAGLGILIHLGFERPAASLLIAAVTFWPPILVHLVVVQKDTQMTAALLFATALLAWSLHRPSRRWPLAAALVALLYALACRYNAIFAVLPLLFLWSQLALGAKHSSVARATALTILITSACVGGLALLTRHLTHGKSLHVVQEIFLTDLAGMSVREGIDLFPAYLHANRPDVNLDWIRAHYRPQSINEMVFSPDAISWDGDRAQRAALRMSWWRAVVDHPAIYAAVRLNLFAHLLGFRPGLVMPVFTHTEPFVYPMSIDTDDARYRTFMGWVHRNAENGLWFRNWVYCVILAIGGAVVIAQRDPLGISLQLSAWLYLLTHVVISPNADFRYAWWVIITALITPAVAALAWRSRFSSAGRWPRVLARNAFEERA